MLMVRQAFLTEANSPRATIQRTYSYYDEVFLFHYELFAISFTYYGGVGK